MKRRAVLAGLFALPVSGLAAQKSATDFVQRFYDAYLKETPHYWFTTVQNRRALLDPVLVSALQEYVAAETKASSESQRLDFDPFLGSEEPGNKFAALRAFAIQGGTRVEVHDVESGSKSNPAVLVDVSPKDGSWIISNFRYPATSRDLLPILGSLRQSRTPSSKR